MQTSLLTTYLPHLLHHTSHPQLSPTLLADTGTLHYSFISNTLHPQLLHIKPSAPHILPPPPTWCPLQLQLHAYKMMVSIALSASSLSKHILLSCCLIHNHIMYAIPLLGLWVLPCLFVDVLLHEPSVTPRGLMQSKKGQDLPPSIIVSSKSMWALTCSTPHLHSPWTQHEH